MKETPKHTARPRHSAKEPPQEAQALGSPVGALLSRPLDTAEVKDVASDQPVS